MSPVLAVLFACSGAKDPGFTDSSFSDSGEALPFSQVSVGIHQSCGVTGGRIACWGPTSDEVTNVATYYGDGDPPAGNDWTRVEMTRMANDSGEASRIGCALSVDGAGFCWGRYFDGGLSLDAEGAVLHDLAVGAVFACSIDEVADLWCWGPNALDGERLASGVQDVTGSGWHVYALHDDGALSSWSMLDPEHHNELSSRSRDRLRFSDEDLELGLVDIGQACAFERTSGDVVCDPFDEGTASDEDGLRALRLTNVGPAAELVAGPGRGGGICALNTAGRLACDAYLDGTPSPGVVGNRVASYSVAAASVASGCLVTDIGAVECWGAATPPQDVRLWE